MARRIALFGQAAFAKDVLVRLLDAGHEIVGVYAPPAKPSGSSAAKPSGSSSLARPDPLAEEAEKRGLRTFRYKAFRREGQAIPERVAEYAALGADLNVMPYTTAILPPEIVSAPRRGSLCFHPSLLPAYRGGAAIPWQIILGARETGVTVFVPDAGVDTGPIVQKGGVAISETATAASLYFDELYPLGVEAMLEAVDAVDSGIAQPRPQSEAGASFQGLVTDEVARIDWQRPGVEVDRLIRGCDPSPGAHARLDGETVRLFDARLSPGTSGEAPGTVLGSESGRLVVALRGARIAIGKLRVGKNPKVAAIDAGISSGAQLR